MEFQSKESYQNSSGLEVSKVCLKISRKKGRKHCFKLINIRNIALQFPQQSTQNSHNAYLDSSDSLEDNTDDTEQSSTSNR